jgi:hypothetical protein
MSCVFARPAAFRPLCIPSICALVFGVSALNSEPVHVRRTEGLVHGFLALRTLEGQKLADGEITQVAKGDRVTAELIFRFRDGSIYRDETVFTQKGDFRLLSEHLLKKGPSFEQPIETLIDAFSGQVTVRYTDHGKQKTLEQKLDLPPDLANGLLFTILKHIDPSTPRTTASMVVCTPKPRLVKIAITPEAEQPLSRGSAGHNAVVYDVKVELGAVVGSLARVTGKQPADTHVWVLKSAVPAFVKAEGPLFQGGPVWRIELATPAGP